MEKSTLALYPFFPSYFSSLTHEADENEADEDVVTETATGQAHAVVAEVDQAPVDEEHDADGSHVRPLEQGLESKLLHILLFLVGLIWWDSLARQQYLGNFHLSNPFYDPLTSMLSNL